MSVRAAADQVHTALSDAMVSGKLPADAVATAEALLKGLRQPVRISLMGLPGAGKSTLVNLLLNEAVIPDGISLPTTQYVHGETPSAVLTLNDGRREEIADADPFKIAAASPMFVEVALPLPALGRISVLEVVAPAVLQDQQRAMHWAAKRSDLALWCTDNFDRSEQALWDTMPDTAKDNGFLLLTHADQAQARGELDHLLASIRQNHAYQFNKIMPIATPSAIAARRPDGSVDKAAMQKSGALTLISSILRQVDIRLQGTVDQAESLVAQYKDAPAKPVQAAPVVEAIPEPVAQIAPEIEVAPEAPKVLKRVVSAARPTNVVEMTTAKPVDMAQVTAKPAPRPRVKSKLVAVEPSRPIAKPVRPATEPAAAVQVPDSEAPRKARPGFMPKARTTAIIPRAKPETCVAYDEAIAYLTKQGRALTQELAANDDISSSALMKASANNIMWLSDYLEDLSISDDPVLEKSRTRAMDAAELVQLMQIEKNESAALDALGLVIQLKRDLEAEIALAGHERRNQAA
jgi:hypothetical protein